MTKIICNINEDTIYFEVLEHTGTEACIAVSSCCNVLVSYLDALGVECSIYESGHVKYDITLNEYVYWREIELIFKAVYTTLQAAAEEFKGQIKIY